MKKEILVFLSEEPDLGLVSRACEMAASAGLSVKAAVLSEGSTLPETKKLFEYGADEVTVIRVPGEAAGERVMGEALMLAIDREDPPEILLAPATVLFRAAFPYLAVLLQAGLTADCTELSLDENGRLIQVRPALGNKLMASIRTLSPVQMATVRPGIYLPVPCGKAEKEVTVIDHDRKTTTTRTSRIKTAAVRLSEARVIFAGGAGLETPENFRYFEEKVQEAGFCTGATRKAVEMGLTSYSHQIGQTGIIVSPEVYIAFGISGAVQHLIGMRSSGYIVAVNTDKKAPIFDYADYGIYGDWRNALDEILKKL